MVIERNLYKTIKPYLKSKEAVVITGMRRVGKTTLLRFVYDKIESSNKLFIDLESPFNQQLFEELDYEKIKTSLEGMGLKFGKKAYLFLDEIQFIKNIPSVVKYLADHYKIKFFLTGSASFYLKNLFSESLAGRKYLFELFPFSFEEFLKLKEEKIIIPKQGVTKFLWGKLNNLYREYVEYGGFPEVVLKKSKQEKEKALKEIFSSYFQMEVKQLGDFKKDNKVRDLLFLLAERVGNKLDIQRLSQELAIARETVYQYLSFLEGTYFLKTIRPFSRSRDVEIRKTPKIYLADSGLANNIAKLSRGALFEQTVFQSLRPKGEINYYQRKTGAEIDFILNPVRDSKSWKGAKTEHTSNGVNKKKAYEVKLNPRRSDINKLKKISKDIGIKFCRIVSLNYSGLEQVIYGLQL